jgi:hypothetical protein
MRKLGPTVVALSGFWLGSKVSAQQADAPDLAFLEYLGSWQAGDDEWVEIAEWDKEHPRKSADKGDDRNDGEKDGAEHAAEPKGKEDDDRGT